MERDSRLLSRGVSVPWGAKLVAVPQGEWTPVAFGWEDADGALDFRAALDAKAHYHAATDADGKTLWASAGRVQETKVEGFYKSWEIIPVKEIRVRQQAENLAFNASLAIPAAWHPNSKIVLSGLSANSAGDGTNAATVMHVVLDEPVQFGRLKRRKGDLLCSADNGSFGLSTIGPDEPVYRATCKACIKAASRFAAVQQAA